MVTVLLVASKRDRPAAHRGHTKIRFVVDAKGWV
jgi:hypothetical protein